MSFDTSRFTFDSWHDFYGVVMQQGRVLVDSDWNELLDELTRRLQAGTLDILGRAVYPATTPYAFMISAYEQSGVQHIAIGAGRMYVDGLLAENRGPQQSAQFDESLAELSNTYPGAPEVDLDYTQQPYLPGVTLPQGSAEYLVYLDVWRRAVTYLECPDLVDKAVNVDTTGRLQTIWQVKILDVSNVAGGVTCSTPDSGIPAWEALTQPSAGQLTNGLVPFAASGPCCLTPNTGYTGMENQNYRVEIHQEGTPVSSTTGSVSYPIPPGTATFKWSRDNASVATAVTAITPFATGGTTTSQLTVQSMGRDQVLGFSPGNWIEITDDYQELNGQHGELHQIIGINAAAKTITLDSPVSSTSFPLTNNNQPDPARHTRIRRWDQAGEVYEIDGATVWMDLGSTGSTGDIPVPPPGTTLILENGITVTFGLNTSFFPGGTFHVFDYWTFAARSADGSIAPLTLAPPQGIHHHYARLAVVTFPAIVPSAPHAGAGDIAVSDCRQPWPPPTAAAGGCCCTVTVGPGDITGNKTLQSILDDLANTQSTICLLPGTYPLPAPLVLTSHHSGFTIEGCTGGVTLQAAPGSEGNFLDGLMVLASASQVMLKGITFKMPLVPFVSAGGKLAGLDPNVLASIGGPQTATLQNLLVSVGLRVMECTDLTVESCNFLYSTPAVAPAIIFTAAEAGTAGNNITVSISVHPGPDVAHSTFDVTVTETDSYTALTMSTVEPVLGSDTTGGTAAGLVRVLHSSLTDVLPTSATHQLTGGTVTAPASVKAVSPGTEAGLTFLAKRNGADGALTAVRITSNPAQGSFDLEATWTKTVTGVTVATAAESLAALGYAVTVAPPSGGAFALPSATQNAPIRLAGGAESPSPKQASAPAPAAQPDYFQVGIFSGGGCSGFKVANNTFGPGPGASAPAMQLWEEPFGLSLGYVLAPTAKIGSVTPSGGTLEVLRLSLQGATWVAAWLDRASLIGNTFNGLGAAALIYGEAGSIRIEDNDVRNSYGGILIYARRTPLPVPTGQTPPDDPLLDILWDALTQIGVALVVGYPLAAAFTDTSAIKNLPALQATLLRWVFPRIPLVRNFDELLQTLNALQTTAANTIKPQELTLSLICSGNVVEALNLAPDASGPGLVVWGEDKSPDKSPTGNVIVSASRFENNTPPFVATVTINLVSDAAINGNLIYNESGASGSAALIVNATVAAAGNIVYGNTNLPASWGTVNVIVSTGAP
jgi:hypothetical protein